MNAPIQAFLFDLDGVLVTGGRPLPGALPTLQRLRAAGVPFLILSNMTLAPRAAMLRRFRAEGLDLPLEAMLTPPAAAARWLRRQAPGPVAAFVTPATQAEFDGLDLVPGEAEAGARYVVIGDMGDGWTAHELNRALRLLLDGGRLITLGMGRYWRAPDGLRLDCGAFTSALSYAAGQAPLVIGKPAPEYFQMALDTLGLEPGRVAMVGDDIMTDIDAAQQQGMAGILVQTGKFQPRDLERGVTPRFVVPTVAEVLEAAGFGEP
jgi:phospholysine phosphohistidine inorganic pyrophosphate phosphatase